VRLPADKELFGGALELHILPRFASRPPQL
jgi:hypothetical protein